MLDVIITIGENGSATIETVSILEDLWHDYLYFRDTAIKATDLLPRKRFERAALMALIAYAEGVVNQWLCERTDPAKWSKTEKKRAYEKVTLLMQHAPRVRRVPVEEATRTLRNALVHLDSSRNATVYQEISLTLLRRTEDELLVWLDEMEKALGAKRHPDTKVIGRSIASDLGRMRAESYSGDVG